MQKKLEKNICKFRIQDWLFTCEIFLVFRDEIKQTLGEIIQNVLWHSIALRLSGKEACPTCKGTLIPPIWSKLSYYLQ